jgi:uncharacterized protein (TIGR03437 family)
MHSWFLLLAAGQLLNAAVLPLVFEPNIGQADSHVRYLAHASSSTLWLTADEAVLGSPLGALRIRFEGGNRASEIKPEGALAGRTNYFIGNDSNRWKRDIPLFERVRYHSVYPGTDVVFYGNPQDLEYDLVLQPGADPRKIRVAYAGVKQMRLDAGGDLLFTVGSSEIRQHKPRIYQGAASIDGHYILLGRNRVGFAVAAYDRTKSLTIDPVVTYASYLGGSAGDGGYAVAIDQQGNILVAGQTQSSDFPAQKPPFPYIEAATTGGPGEAIFVAKINPAASSGASIVWATFFGGTSGDWARGVAVDRNGNVYMTGTTASPDFPIKGAFQSKPGSGVVSGGLTCGGTINGAGVSTAGVCPSAFVVKLNPAGNQIVYSSYLGGENGEDGFAIAVDPAGNASVAGRTYSNFFPVRGGYQTHRSGVPNGFLSTVSADGSTLLYSTYFGGEGNDLITGLAADAAGLVYAGGTANSSHFPVTQSAYQKNRLGPDYDGFVAKFDPSQTGAASLLYSSYLGGGSDGDSFVNAVAADSVGNIFATGGTYSATFPVTAGAFQSKSGSAAPNAMGYSFTDAFLTKINPAAQGPGQIAYSSYTGGFGYDYGVGIAVDSAGRITIAGATNTFDFPTTPDAFECCFAGTLGDYRGFVVRADPSKAGSAGLVYSTYFGGVNGSDILAAVALDSTGNNVAVTGTVSSSDVPLTASAFQGRNGNPRAQGVTPGTAFVEYIKMASSGPVIGYVVNGASFQGGTVSPGMIFTIGGTGLGPDVAAGPQLDAKGNVSTLLAGSQVTVAGLPAPILYASAKQINAVVPYGVPKSTFVFVQVIYNGLAGSTLAQAVSATAPAIFAGAGGQGAILNQDGSVNGSANPAAKGTYVSIYGTGEGLTNPAVPDGHLANETLDKLARPIAAVSLTIGGVPVPPADIIYAGAAPQNVAGLFQVTAKIPATVASGNAAVVITLGTGPAVSSQKGVTVAVQ